MYLYYSIYVYVRRDLRDKRYFAKCFNGKWLIKSRKQDSTWGIPFKKKNKTKHTHTQFWTKKQKKELRSFGLIPFIFAYHEQRICKWISKYTSHRSEILRWSKTDHWPIFWIEIFSRTIGFCFTHTKYSKLIIIKIIIMCHRA